MPSAESVLPLAVQTFQSFAHFSGAVPQRRFGSNLAFSNDDMRACEQVANAACPKVTLSWFWTFAKMGIESCAESLIGV